ncbi:MAG: PAS domain-containing protein [bacterium]|nr:PAS domain-containing protein [bacterium]
MVQWVDHLMNDHARIERALVMIERQLNNADKFDAATVGALLEFLFDYGDRYHNQKEELALFPLLGQRGIPMNGGPIAVMLSEHKMEKEYLLKLSRDTFAIKEKTIEITPKYREELAAYIALTKDHIWKENDILYPMGRRVLDEDDDTKLMEQFAEVAQQMPYQGVGYIERWDNLLEAVENTTGGRVDLLKSLNTNTIRAMLDAIPVELTFIDADDVVRYFNKVYDPKIFPRTLSVVGRTVQQCHPPKSVHLVEQILTEMKAGTRDSAAFWIPFGEQKEMFLHISYYAVRDGEGNYLGCVEMNQDIAPLRSLEGQSRTLSSMEVK